MSLEKLTVLKKELDNLRRRKIEVQSDMKNLDKEKVKLLAECTALKVNPKAITEEIKKQEEIIETTINNVKRGLESLNGSH
ncbi:MAG: hypothetical protein V3U54_08950 [Thermodesulfobacteriota bacterium]